MTTDDPLLPPGLASETSTPFEHPESFQPRPVQAQESLQSPASVSEPLVTKNDMGAMSEPDGNRESGLPDAEVSRTFSDAWKQLGFRTLKIRVPELPAATPTKKVKKEPALIAMLKPFKRERNTLDNDKVNILTPNRKPKAPVTDFDKSMREALRNLLQQQGWRTFNGTVIIQGDHGDPGASVVEARRAEAHMCTPDNIEINIFCDGSGPGSKNKGMAGYAIAFKKNRPGQSDDQQEVLMAWQMDPGVSSYFAEALALAQALVQARHEVVATIKAFLESLNSTTSKESAQNALEDSATAHRLLLNAKPIVVNIFSDSTPSLGLAPIHRIQWNDDDLKTRIARLSFDAADALVNLEIPEIGTQPRVKVQLQWLPSHIPGNEVRLHVLADRAAAEARIWGSFLQVGSEEPQTVESGLYDALQEHFIKSMVKAQGPRNISKRELEAGEGTLEPKAKRRRRIEVNKDFAYFDTMLPRLGIKRGFGESSNPTPGAHEESSSGTGTPRNGPPKKKPKQIAPALIRWLDTGQSEPGTLRGSERLTPTAEEHLGTPTPNNCIRLASDDLAANAELMDEAARNPAPANAKFGQEGDQPFFFDLGSTRGATAAIVEAQNRFRSSLVVANRNGGLKSSEDTGWTAEEKPRHFSGNGNAGTMADASTQTCLADLVASNTAPSAEARSPFVFHSGITAAATEVPASSLTDRLPVDSVSGYTAGERGPRRRRALKLPAPLPRCGGRNVSLSFMLKRNGDVKTLGDGDPEKRVEDIVGQYAPEQYSPFMKSSYH